jgi:hypothetical protein
LDSKLISALFDFIECVFDFEASSLMPCPAEAEFVRRMIRCVSDFSLELFERGDNDNASFLLTALLHVDIVEGFLIVAK